MDKIWPFLLQSTPLEWTFWYIFLIYAIYHMTNGGYTIFYQGEIDHSIGVLYFLQVGDFLTLTFSISLEFPNLTFPNSLDFSNITFSKNKELQWNDQSHISQKQRTPME